MIQWDRLQTVEAPLMFASAAVTTRYHFTRPPEMGPEEPSLRDTRRVRIHDVRPVVDQLRFEVEGFQVGRLDPSISNYEDPAQIADLWVPAARELVKAKTGASLVHSWACNMRYSPKLPGHTKTPVSAPARMVHTDFSPGPYGKQVDNEDVDTLIARLTGSSRKRHWRFFNVWQAFSPPPHDTPLALCDNSSTGGEDYVSAYGTSTYVDGTQVNIEVGWVKYQPRQRWAYVSDLRTDEALVFCGMDMAAGPTCRRVPHVAFDNPDCPPDAAPRNSLEVRTVAIFD